MRVLSISCSFSFSLAEPAKITEYFKLSLRLGLLKPVVNYDVLFILSIFKLFNGMHSYQDVLCNCL